MASATFTFLFTDLQGSTRLWERHPQAMAVALARHDALLAAAIAAHGGQVVKRTGDGCHAVFPSALDGALAALDAQAALIAEPWAELAPDRLRARMALHTGEAEARDGDYFGPSLNRAARLMAAGHGGQVLLSETAAALARDALPPDVSLLDLGEHRLRDLTRPEHFYQLSAPGLPADFPSLRALDVVAHNLPVQLTSFIGRERELDQARRLLSGTRLLTLTGPGGTGKTRLSLQVAAEALDSFPDGAWLVELAPLADPALVPSAVAAIWQVREQPGRTLTDALIDYLRARHLLLLLDNCEHLIEACAALAAALLSACPRLTVLASSREALGVPGETAYRVPSLAVPDEACASPASLLQFDAARLFVERAQSAQPRFAPDAQNLPVITQICRRLDGIPLAIELAAARVRLLSVGQIAARLGDRFRLLTGGSRTALPRQQTLRALIDWSYDLLPEAERAALRQLSVFAGGWTLEAAEAVIGAEALDLLSHLVDRSLVAADEAAAGAVRYRLLETIRQYGREKLFDAGDAGPARRRHLDYYLALTRQLEPKLRGAELVATLEQLDLEQDNLRTALDWALDNDPWAAVRLASGLDQFWARRDRRESLRLLQAVLERSAATPPAANAAQRQADLEARAKALYGEAIMAFGLGDNPAGQVAIEASIAQARQVGATRALAMALGLAGLINGMLGEVTQARAWAAESVALSQEHGFAFELGLFGGTQLFLAAVAQEAPPLGADQEYLRAARASGNPFAIGMAMQNVARLARASGRLDEAVARYSEAAQIFEQLRDRNLNNSCRSDMAHLRRQQGRLAEAVALYRETVPVWLELGSRAAAAHDVECLAFIAQAEGQPERAARLLGAAEVERERLRSPMGPMERREYDEQLAALRAVLPAPALETAWAAGRTMSLDEAVAYALHKDAGPGPERPQGT